MNFELPFIPKRTVQPREKGLTMVMDKGLSVREAENLMDASGHITDIVKLGFGSSYITPNLDEKIRIYKEAGMKVYFGGTLFEAFYARNKFDDFLRTVDKFGLDTLEISDGSIIIPQEEKLDLIQQCSKNYTVLSEVGSKLDGLVIAPNKWISMMNAELEAGSWKVIAEARESGNVGIFKSSGKAHTILINKILNKVDNDNILWEAPKKEQQVFFVQLLGANVNLGNIAPNEVIACESLRLGLRGDTFFDNLPEDVCEKLTLATS